MAETETPVQDESPGGPEERPDVHIKGVGSFVTLDFKKGTAHKAYRPRWPVKLLYFLAFQAPFPYSNDRDALEASRERRVIVGLLTKYWFGIDIVAPVVEIAEEDNGEVAFVTQLVEGNAPENAYRARSFLRLVTHHFIEAGLPTWQVSPHNPRAVGNLMEVHDGTYRIIDLESNLVAALTPMSAVSSAIQQKQFPNFDDIDTKTLETYLSRHGHKIRNTLGSDDYLKLMDSALAYAEYSSRWHSREPRILGKIIKIVFTPVDRIGRVVRFFKGVGAGGQVRAEVFVRRGINVWLNEGKITQQEAEQLRRGLQEPEVATAMYHMGVQTALNIVLIIPFLSSVERFFWTILHRLFAELKGLVTRKAPHSARDLHTLKVAVFSIVPKAGAAAYLLSPAMSRNRGLVGIGIDRALRHLPFKLYRRLKLAKVGAGIARIDENRERPAAASA